MVLLENLRIVQKLYIDVGFALDKRKGNIMSLRIVQCAIKHVRNINAQFE